MANIPESAPSSSQRPYGGVSAAQRQSQRRERLLDAAKDVFGTEGFSRATMRLICAKARLTERYFYEHFEGLQEVFVVVHQRLSEQLITVIGAAYMAHYPGDADPRLRACLRAFFEFIKQDPRHARILLNDAVFTGRANVMDKTTAVQRYLQVLESRINTLYPGVTQKVDIELIAGGLVGLVIHTATIWAARGFHVSVDQLLDHNLYAWRGLDGWLSSLVDEQGGAATVPTTPTPSASSA